jgi:hypothetical protein
MNFADFFTAQASPAPSFTNQLFGTVQSLAPSVAGIFTAQTNASAQKASAKAGLQAAQLQAAATQSWTKYLPILIIGGLGLGALFFIVSLFRKKS